jgi:hypothetical protein
MKKLIAFLLALTLCVSLCACGGSTDEAEPEETTATEQEEPSTEETEEPEEAEPEEPSADEADETEIPVEDEVTIYTPGDVIETDLFKITPSFTGYAYELDCYYDEDVMTPFGTMDDDGAFNAREGKVEIYGEIQIEYIGNEKSDVSLDMGISVDFDDGYIYECSNMVFCKSVDGDWSSNFPIKFEPLSSETTRILRYCIEVPEQVETDTDKSLLTTITVNGEPYVFDFRAAEVRGSDFDPRGEFYQPVDDETKTQIVEYLKANGLEQVGWYSKTVGVFTFTFGDTDVSAVLPINSSYQYEFSGTYEVYSGTILISWDYGDQMHLDYTFDGTTLNIVSFEHDR